jgi:hypothetical protein
MSGRMLSIRGSISSRERFLTMCLTTLSRALPSLGSSGKVLVI